MIKSFTIKNCEFSIRKEYGIGLGIRLHFYFLSNIRYKIKNRTMCQIPVIRKDYVNIGIDILFWHIHILYCGSGNCVM